MDAASRSSRRESGSKKARAPAKLRLSGAAWTDDHDDDSQKQPAEEE